MYRGDGEIYSRSSVLIFVAIIFLLAFPLKISAKVTGVCTNCHTMHNSQNGSAEHRSGEGVGWDATPELAGGSLDTTPANNLLVTGCVGCHSSTTGNTIINKDGSEVPIVYNVNGPTQNILAGGNFYWSASDSTKGHNIYGIAGPDTMSQAPGKKYGCGTGSCHYTLADPPTTDNFYRGGCQGCHVFTYHHEDNEVYRFLKGHGESPSQPLDPARKDYTQALYADYVVGEEDDDWEQETSVDHNYYKGLNGPVTGQALLDTHSVSNFCGGCHGKFHQSSDIGTGSPWQRHPTDIELPQGDGSEFAEYDPVNSYDPNAPVAWTDPTNISNRGTPIVMCLSCHRPHGSDQSDMLRWNYSGCVAGTPNSDCGCFTCHTEKDGT